MTKQEILEYFKDINHAYNESTRLDDLSHMLDELMQSNSDEDCINRQGAIDALGYNITITLDKGLDEYRTDLKKMLWKIYDTQVAQIKALPSIQPKPKTGHWEWVQYDSNPKIGNFHCSECNFMPASFNWASEHLKYCPNCGAKMEGDKE